MHTTKAEVHWGDVALGITPPYSYCHTGYIPSVTVAVSHLVHTGHRVYTLGILGTHWVYTASYYPTVYFLTLQLLSHWVLLRLTATFTLGITPPLKSN